MTSHEIELALALDRVSGWAGARFMDSIGRMAKNSPGLLLPRLRDEVSAARIFRANHGVPSRVDVARNRALGNTVDPKIPEIIGRAIMRASAVTSQTQEIK